MAHHKLLPRQYLILGLVAVVRSSGRYLPFARHDQHAGHLAGPSATLIAAVFTPWIALGIALLIGFFASYLTALSWADLTFVLPATAFGNVIVALLVALLAARGNLLATLGGDCAHHAGRGLRGQGTLADRDGLRRPPRLTREPKSQEEQMR